MSEEEDKLQALYRQRKAGVETPDAIRNQLMSRATRDGRHPPRPWYSFGYQLQLVAACAMLVVLGVLIKTTLWQVNDEYAADKVISVETIDAPPGELSDTLNREYLQAKQALKDKQLVMAVHHKQAAMLAKRGEFWELKVCDRPAISLSPALLAKLAASDSLGLDLEAGRYVEVAFSKAGDIVGIRNSDVALKC